MHVRQALIDPFLECLMIRNRLIPVVVAVASAGLLPAADTVGHAEVADHYADIVITSYRDSAEAARDLRTAIAAFVQDPTPITYGTARKAWLAAREPYGQTEVYRFYQGPIDDEDGPEGLLNAWPLDENYIDGTPDRPDHGIIQQVDEYPTIDANLLRSLNEKDGDANISTGYHAIEYLLWGQDLNDDPTSAGRRPLSDYTTDEHADRRKQYLTVATDVLLADMERVIGEWENGYRSDFVADPADAVGKIIVGIGSLAGGELAGERMHVALLNKDQEDEHSCFSDNTHRDIVTNARGIMNVWLGHYRDTDGELHAGGPGLRALVVVADPDLASTVDQALTATMNAVSAIRAPFDHEIQAPAGRERVQNAIQTLWTLARLMPQVADAIGVEVAIDGL